MDARKFLYRLITIVMIASSACACFAQDNCVDLDATASYRKPLFGNDKTVFLLGGILKSEDVYQRLEATQNLGETNNSAAIDFIIQAGKDISPLVRATAIQSAACFPDSEKTQKIIIAALEDKDQKVQLTAISEAAKIQLKSAVDKIASLAKSGSADIQLASLNALSDFKIAADVSTLKQCLAAENFPLKLAAIKNSLFVLPEHAEELKDIVVKLTADKDIPIQAGAVKFIGRLYLEEEPLPATMPASTQPTATKPAKKAVDPYLAIVKKAAESKNSILRRAAVEAYSLAGINETIPAFLEDESISVRNAALIALAKQPAENSGSAIFDIWENANDRLTNKLCSNAMLALADSTIRQSLLDYIKSNIDIFTAIDRQEEKTRYNLLQLKMVAACNILGELKYKPAYNALVDCAKKVKLDSEILGSAAIALGKIGNSSAIRPLEKILDKTVINGKKYLIAMATMRTPPPFSSAQAAMVIKSLGMLKSTSSVDKIITLAGLNYMGMFLNEPAAQGCETLSELADNSNRNKIEKFIVYMIDTQSIGTVAKLKAIRSAGTLKIKKAQPELECILNEDRPMKILMQASAWAIGRITGKTPPVGKPIANNGEWIIKSLD